MVNPSNQSTLPRRSVLTLLGSMLGSAALAGWTPARAEGAMRAKPAPRPFDFERLIETMQARARQSYVDRKSVLPTHIRSLDYDSYRKIEFRADRARWRSSDYEISPYHLSPLYAEPVELYEVVGGEARPLTFSNDDFNFWDTQLARASAAEPVSDIAGFRVNSPINHPGSYDELVSFLGASYFRAVGRGNVYGVSARGLALTSAIGGDEEFPRFTEFYLERGRPGEPLVICAALESPSVTGAYRFAIEPADADEQATSMLVSMHLNFREDVDQVGIAPLTSMFLFAENNRSAFDDYRPQVHDSEALVLWRRNGERLYRPLNNPPAMANSFIFDSGPEAFGLVQRDREFDHYSDPGAQYERRPSLLVEPIGDWGQGDVRLFELPTRVETFDNIVAFWVPGETPKAGEMRQFAYRLRWGDILPDPDDELAHVAATMTGPSGAAGAPSDPAHRKFVVDFAGGLLSTLPDKTQVDILCQITGGRLINSTLQKIAANDSWRMVLDVDTSGGGVVEMRAYLAGAAKILTETWLYQWRTPA